jgi:hypothetical protein
MAFHPFQFFRKRQKTFLAILTIFVMFIFILSYGKGDAFTWLMSLLGAERQKDSTPVTTLYNKTITVTDVDQLRLHRRVADRFVMAAQMMAAPNLTGTEQQDVMMRLAQVSQNPLLLRNDALLRQRLRGIQQELNKDGKTDEARYVAWTLRNRGLQLWRLQHPSDLYFGGTLATEDLLDFKLWLRQADKLGIVLTDEDVRKLVNHEAGTEVLTGDPLKDGDKVSSAMGGAFRNVSAKDLYNALRDEFRVRLAQESLLGSSQGARAALGTGLAGDDLPAGATPEQFWEFFKDNRTSLDVGFVKVPVSQFTGQVKEEPTEKELKDLFERYKNNEPNPESDKPGFKVPRRIKVEWVSANADSPFFANKAAEALQVLDAARPHLARRGPGDSALSAAMRLAAALMPDLAVKAEYDSYVKSVRSWWDANSLIPDPSNPYSTGLRRPDTVAAVIGQAVGAGTTGATPLTAAVTLGGHIDLRLAEQRARAASIALAGSSPFLPAIIADEAAYVTIPVKPLDAVRADMVERARTRLGPQLAEGALKTFKDELDAKRFTPKDAAEYVKTHATPEHGITSHAIMADARDVTDIANDPALAPLREARALQIAMTPQDARAFADTLFKPSQLFHPEEFRTPSGAEYYFWLTESDKAYVPTFDQAKPKVETAWKSIKARELARKAAEQLIAAMKQKPEGTSAERFLRDEALRHGYEWFTPVTPIAKLVTVPDPMGGFMSATQYGPYRFDEAKMPYPQKDTVDTLFRELKHADDATVLRDRPDRTYYVAALLKNPAVPTEEEFFKVYQKAPHAGFLPDSLWTHFQSERDEQYRTALVKQFRAEATKQLEDDGSYKLDPEVRRRLSLGRADTGEE